MKFYIICLKGLLVGTASVASLLIAHAVHSAAWALLTGLTFTELFQSPLIMFTGIALGMGVAWLFEDHA